MPRRWALTATWVAGTLAATALAWAAVARVIGDVGPSAPVAMPAALLDPSEAPGTATAEPEPAPAPAGEPTTDPTAPSTAPPTAAVEDPAPDAAATTEAYDLVGGVVVVRYEAAGSASLVSATPRSGFAAEVQRGGPDRVEVRFRSDDHESRLEARWGDGRPDVTEDERPR